MAKMRCMAAIVFITLLVCATQSVSADKQAAPVPPSPQSQGYAGSVSCRECHEQFYQLWSTSKHGLAMQPYTAEFAKVQLTPQQNDVKIGKSKYRVDISEGVVIETNAKGNQEISDRTGPGRKERLLFPDAFQEGEAPDPSACL